MRFGFVLLAVGAGLALRGTVVLAYREVISLGEVKRCSAAVVLGTLQNVKRVPLADGTARLSEPRHGFAFDLKICEVLHGKADELGKEVRIGYSSAGNGGVWEFAEPADGLKVLAYLQRAEDGRWGLVPSCEVVTALPNFERPKFGRCERSLPCSTSQALRGNWSVSRREGLTRTAGTGNSASVLWGNSTGLGPALIFRRFLRPVWRFR